MCMRINRVKWKLVDRCPPTRRCTSPRGNKMRTLGVFRFERGRKNARQNVFCWETGDAIMNRSFVTCCRFEGRINAFRRNKSLSSYEWLERHLKDPYVEKAKIENYRCRSAFKLMEIDDKHKIIYPGQCVIDIGAAPGSWTQVLVKRTNSNKADPRKKVGLVVSVDRSPIYPVEGAELLSGLDFTKETSRKRVEHVLNNRKLDFVFSDMAPNASGVKSLDHDNFSILARSVLLFAVHNLRQNGGCLIKTMNGVHSDVSKEMKKFFPNIKFVKPASSYMDSSEIFILARDFRGL